MATSVTKYQNLFEFCINGDRIGLADYIITNKCNPSAYDVRNDKDQTTLHIACQYGHLFVVRSLIEVFGCSAQVRDVSGNLPVHYACQHGHLPIVDYLLHFKGQNNNQAIFETDSEGSNLLHKACQSGSAPVVRYLQEIICHKLKQYVPRKLNLYCDSIAAYDMAVQQMESAHDTRLVVYGLLTKNKRGDTPLHIACHHGHLAIVKLFKMYVPFMKQFNLALIATRCNHIDLARYIHSLNLYGPFIDVDSESLDGIEESSFELFTGSFQNYNPKQHWFQCPKCNASYMSTRLSKNDCIKCQVTLSLLNDQSLVNNLLEVKGSNDRNSGFSPPYIGCLQATALSGNMQTFNEIEVMPYPLRSAALSGNVFNEAVAKAAPLRLQMLKAKSFDSATLHAACVSDNVQLVKHIMETLHCGPNVRDPHGNTPLHVVCEWGSYNVFLLLLKCKDLKRDVLNNKNETALLLACKYGRYDFCEHLLDCSSIANQETPLHLACTDNHVTAEILTKLVSTSVVNSVDQYGDTPIFNACRCGNLAMVQFLIEKGSNPLFVNTLTKETPVHIACRTGKHDILEVLLYKSPTTKFKGNTYKATPIQLAIESGCEKTLVVLLKTCGNKVLNSKLNVAQQTLAHFVCITCDVHTTEYLVKRDVNWNAQDVYGNTPLHFACCFCCIEIVKLIAPYCKVTIQDNDRHWTPIHVASQNGFVAILDILLKKINVSDGLDELTDKDGNTALHLASQAQSYFSCEIAEQLFPYCSLTAKNNVGSKTPLHIACKSGHLALIQILLNKLRSLNIEELLVDSDLNTILHVAVDSLEVVRAVLDVVQPVHKNKQGETPIHMACRNGDLDIVRLLVTKAAELVLTDNGDSYLHSACFGISLEVVKFLAEESGLDFDKLMCPNSVGDTPLHYACIIGDFDLVSYMMVRASEYAQSLNKNDLTPFCYLLLLSHCDTVQRILSNKLFDEDKLCKTERSLLHCVFKYLNDLTEVLNLIKFIVNEKISDPLKCDLRGNTILHCFLLQISAHSSHDLAKLWYYLLTIPGVQLCAQNEDGDTPLHLLVQMVSKYFICDETLTAYLDEATPVDSNLVNLRNADGKTAIQFARPKVTRLFIKYGANPEDVSALYSKLLAGFKNEHSLEPSTKILLLGNSKAGKSTLVQTINSLHLPTNQLAPVIDSTAGIKTIDHNSKILGCVTFKDFGGQPQFESGNAVFLKTAISIDYPPIFLAVVNVSQEDFVQRIQYWFSYIRDNTPIQLVPHVIIIGSHSDCISVSDHQRVKEHINLSVKNMKSCKLHVANLTLIDCRDVRSEQIEMLSQVLADSSKQLRRSLELDCRCHVLIAYLTKWYKHTSEVAFKEIQDKISTASNSDDNVILPVASHALLELLKTLHSGGHITLLNPDNIDHCWVVLDDTLLYDKVNGTLFAPSDQTFNVPRMPTNVGVITSDTLKSVFKDKNIDLITAYIIHSELGQRIEDSESVKLIQSACSSQDTTKESQIDSGTSLEVTSQDVGSVVPSGFTDLKYLFFPGLVKSKRPSDVWGDDLNSSYSFCWYMKCKVEQFFSQRFLQVLLLRLTFNFVSKKSSSKQLHRKCNIWKNGIHWSTMQGVEVLVEVIEQISAVVLLMRFTKGHEIEGVEFRSKLITKILHTKNEFCPNTEVFEFLFPQIFKYPINTQAANIPICQVAQAITNGDPCVVDSKSKPHELSKLLFYEPFIWDLECLWHEENQKNQVSTELLTKVSQSLKVNKEMAARGEELLARIAILTYDALRTLLGCFSIFRDRDPFVSA